MQKWYNPIHRLSDQDIRQYQIVLIRSKILTNQAGCVKDLICTDFERILPSISLHQNKMLRFHQPHSIEMKKSRGTKEGRAVSL